MHSAEASGLVVSQLGSRAQKHVSRIELFDAELTYLDCEPVFDNSDTILDLFNLGFESLAIPHLPIYFCNRSTIHLRQDP